MGVEEGGLRKGGEGEDELGLGGGVGGCVGGGVGRV